MEGAGEARQSVPMVKGVDYIFRRLCVAAAPQPLINSD